MDLAPLAGRLPSRRAVAVVVKTYSRYRRQRITNHARFMELTRITALWQLAEVTVRLKATGHAMFERYREGYGQKLPAWLATFDQSA